MMDEIKPLSSSSGMISFRSPSKKISVAREQIHLGTVTVWLCEWTNQSKLPAVDEEYTSSRDSFGISPEEIAVYVVGPDAGVNIARTRKSSIVVNDTDSFGVVWLWRRYDNRK